MPGSCRRRGGALRAISAGDARRPAVDGPAERVQGGVRGAGCERAATRRRWRCRRPSRRGAGRGRRRTGPGGGVGLAVLLGGGPQLGGRGVGGRGVLEGDQQPARPLRDVRHGPDEPLDDGGGRRLRQGGGELGAVGQRHVGRRRRPARGRRRRAAGPACCPGRRPSPPRSRPRRRSPSSSCAGSPPRTKSAVAASSTAARVASAWARRRSDVGTPDDPHPARLHWSQADCVEYR